MIKFLFISKAEHNIFHDDDLFITEVRKLGEFTIRTDGDSLNDEERAELIRNCDILITGHGSSYVPSFLAADPGNLKYICHLTGSLVFILGNEIISSDIPVTNWGNAPSHYVAEGAMSLLFGMVKNLRPLIKNVEDGGRGYIHIPYKPDTLKNKNIGVYGFGYIGRTFIEMLPAFKPVIRMYDPYAQEVPEYVEQVGNLRELFVKSEIIVIHAGLNKETEGSVTRELLSLLPDGGIIINTARGGIIDQNALWDEVLSGRLRAGIDHIIDDADLPQGHELRQMPNLIFSGHQVTSRKGKLYKNDDRDHFEIGLDNIKRFIEGRELKFVIDEERFRLMS